MDHGTHVSTGSAGADGLALAIRLLLLSSTALVGGAGLARPLTGAVSRAAGLVVAVAAAVSAALAVTSVVVLGVDVVGGVVHALLTVAVAALVARPSVVRWPASALVLLVVLETAHGRSGLEFMLDVVFVAGATTWFGIALAATGAGGWRSETVRPGPLVLALGVVLTLAGVVHLVVAAPGFDRRLYTTAAGLTALVVVVLPLVVTVVVAVSLRRRTTVVQGYRYGAVGMVACFLAWTAGAAIPEPPELPMPGVPLLATASLAGHDVPILVSPHRPGRNLVHVPASAGDGVSVGVEGDDSVPAVLRAGAQGAWAEVHLPPGRSDLVVRHGAAETTVEVDTGTGAGPASAVGSDGPECASAALGGLVAGAREVLATCPADALSEPDADALRKLVGYLAGRGVPAITLAADTSARGRQAAEVIRAAAGESRLPVTEEQRQDAALVVVSGWSGASTTLTRAAAAQREEPAYGYGVHLAPWLLTGPLASTVATSSVPLRFDPRAEPAVTFTVSLGNAFGGERPSVDGYRRWLAARGQQADEDVRLFATAQVNVMPMSPDMPHAPGMAGIGEGAGHWIEHGTVIPVSLPLQP